MELRGGGTGAVNIMEFGTMEVDAVGFLIGLYVVLVIIILVGDELEG